MGRHQQAEASGIISFMACATLAWIAMDLYLQFAPAIWRVTQRLFTVCRNHRGMWSHLVHLGVCAQLQVDDVETWLDHSYSPYLRDTRFVRGLRVDHFRHGVHAAFHCQQHDGVAHVKRLSDCALRRDLGGRRLCHVRTGGTHECQDHRILVAVFRGIRCQHRRIDVR